MNLHDIASQAISIINPLQTITITPRSSYSVNEYGEAVASSGESYDILADVQPVTSEDIKFINNYNQSTVYKAFWVSSDAFGLNRPMAKAGDKVAWGNQVFYIVSRPEDWYNTSGWSHFVGALQLNETVEEESNDSNS